MIHKLRFDVRDVPACARLGLSARKIWVFFKALILVWAIWNLFVYLGFLAAGEDLAGVWSRARLLPLPGGILLESWPGLLLVAVGGLLIVYALQLASLKVSRITFEQVRGDDFYSGKDASGFAADHWKPLIAAPAALIVGALLALLAGWLTGLVGQIPAAGQVIVAVLSVPLYGAALVLILTIVALLLGLLLIPAIVAATRGDTFETLFELFSTLTSQPWRLALYSLVKLVVSVLALVVFLVFTSTALGLLSWVIALPGGGVQGLGATMVNAPQYFGPELAGSLSGFIDPIGLVGRTAEPWTGIAGVLARASGWAVFLVVICYMLSMCSSGWTLIYLALRHRKDGEDLLLRADDEDGNPTNEVWYVDPNENVCRLILDIDFETAKAAW